MKKFNVTGLCVPRKHYMVDIGAKVDTILRDYIEPGEYFTINRARQFGKTTTLALLARRLQAKYLVIDLSFEGKEDYFVSRVTFVEGLCRSIFDAVKDSCDGISAIWEREVDEKLPLEDLRSRITEFCAASEKPVVIMVDEVDRASDFTVFAAFLGLLRELYLKNSATDAPTFHSVILAGVHDVKNLRRKIRPEEQHSYNSPWNIAADFRVDLSFSAPEIATMLVEYEGDHVTGMDIPVIAERLFYYTSGYPFLVSRLCKTVDEDLHDWTVAGVDAAETLLLKSRNTLFDDMVKNIANNPDFAELLRRILLEGVRIGFMSYNPDVELGLTFGILAERAGGTVVSNIVFETLITEYFLSLNEMVERGDRGVEDRSLFVHDGHLDMDAICQRFSAFMRSEYRDEDGGFIERQGRLLFLSFLRPIINGRGHYAVEPETRGSRRMDVVVFYGREEHIVELKIWRGPQAEDAAYGQLAAYLKSRGQTRGWLVSFADTLSKPREDSSFDYDGCTITETVIAYRDRT